MDFRLLGAQADQADSIDMGVAAGPAGGGRGVPPGRVSRLMIMSWARLGCVLSTVLLAGCDGLIVAVQRGESEPGQLRVGLGWSEADKPGEAARQAVIAALKQVAPGQPRLLLIWDNWPRMEDGRRILAAVTPLVADSIIYGGHVTWPASERWTPRPTVLAMAFGGDWQVTAASQSAVLGREAEAGRLLAGALSLPPARPPLFSLPTTQPGDGRQADRTRPGQVVLLSGHLSGPGAGRLVSGFTERAGRWVALVGGAGSWEGGGGWQYAAGRLSSNSVWAVRLTGPFRARAVLLAAEPDSSSVRQTLSLAGQLVAGRGEGGTPGPSWSLVLLVMSSGWLAYLDNPAQAVSDAVERLDGQRAVHLAGWAGDAQFGPQPDDGALAAGRFSAAGAVIEPLAPEPPTSQPASGP